MSVIEAMLTGLPVVATDISGPREQVVHGETGLLVPPGQVAPLAAALRAPGRRPGAARGDGRRRPRRAPATCTTKRSVVARTLDLLGLPV